MLGCITDESQLWKSVWGWKKTCDAEGQAGQQLSQGLTSQVFEEPFEFVSVFMVLLKIFNYF